MCECKESKDLSLDEKTLEYNRLWEYFQYHAKQRLETFRFYIIMAGAILSGFIALFTRNAFGQQASLELVNLKAILSVKLGLGFILIIFSIAYWVLDKRNNMMINAARTKLIDMETMKWFRYSFFKEIEDDTKKYGFFRFHHCFNAIFFIFTVIGIIIVFYSFIQLLLLFLR